MKTSSTPEAGTMNYCVYILIAFAVGIGVTTEYSPTYENSIIVLIALLSLAMIVLCNKYFKKINKKILHSLLFLLFFLLGSLLAGPAGNPPQAENHIYNSITERSEVVLSGILISAPFTSRHDSEPRTRFIIKTNSIRTGKSNRNKMAVGLIKMTMRGELPDDLQPGDQLLIKSKLGRPGGFDTPGSFDYVGFLAEKSIWVTGWISSPLNILKINRLKQSDEQQTIANYLTTYPERIRYRISNFLDKSLDQEQSALYKAILVGDKSSVPAKTIEYFKACGVMHILAISGMHMGLLFLTCVFFFSTLLKRSTRFMLSFSVTKTAMVLSIIPLAFYALIAGLNTPVLRALLMSSIFVLSILMNRTKSILNNVAIAALLILFMNPSALYSVSFQLSFGAVFSIATFFPHLESLLREKFNSLSVILSSAKQSPYALVKKVTAKHWSTRLPAKIGNGLIVAVSVAIIATLGTAPLLIYHFNRISLLSPISTLIIEPLVCLWALIPGLMACLLFPFSQSTATFLLKTGGMGLSASGWVAERLASLPFSDFYFFTPSVWEIIAYYLLLFSLLHLRRPLFRRMAVVAILAIILLPIYFQLAKTSSTTTRVSYLDVGQGTATVVQFPSGITALIDGGGPSGNSFNIGERVIAPFLWKNRINKLDTIIVTHEHGDHYNGLPFIIDKFKPERIWMNPPASRQSELNDLLNAAKRQKTTMSTPDNSQVILQAGTSVMSCIFNPAASEKNTKANDLDISFNTTANNKSLILKIIHFQDGNASLSKSFLFPGDIEQSLEKMLIRSTGKDIDADILLAPHHGSSSSNSQLFIKAVSPEFLVVSAGDNSRYFPAPDLEKRCHKNGITFFLTSDDGTISFETNGTSLKIKTGRLNREFFQQRRPR